MPAKNLISFIETLPIRLMSCLPCKNRILNQYILQSAKECEWHCDKFVSVYNRPKYASQVISVEKETEIQRKTAIIMQGPLIDRDNFTVETVKIYGKLYPGATVIISTWRDEPFGIISQLEKLENCEVVLGDLPQHSGMLNLNYQIYSTMAGINKAKELGKDYVFKTRCDFRFLKIGLIDFLVALCREFPVDDEITYQKERLIVGGDVLASYFRAFWVADRFCFGRTDDMSAYWDYELDAVDSPRSVVKECLDKNPMTWREVTEAGLCAEPRILLNYLKRMSGRDVPECSVKNFWEILKRQFITVSFEETGAFWLRGNPDECAWKGIYYGGRDSDNKCLCYNWDFTKWMALYMGNLQYSPEYEIYQERNIGFD